MHRWRLHFHKICSVNEAFTRYSSMVLFLVTEEQSSRRREPTKAVRRLGNETQEGNEEALTAYVTTGKGRMRGLARESRMIPEWHCCSLIAETGLRKIGQWRAGTRKRIRPFALPRHFGMSSSLA